jgi:cobalt-zinc-cadmium efflux system outer membrane protein
LRWSTEIKFRQAREVLEEAKQIPDPKVQAGYRHISSANLNGLVAALSIPLPVFDNNSGAVQEAFNRRKQAEQQRRQIEISLRSQFEELYQTLLVLNTDIDQSNKIIIPQAEKAFRIINDGYLSGKFRFLDVLDAQRTLYETRKNLITSLTEYNIRVAELERLIGRSIAGITN